MLEFTKRGIYCPRADIYIDPWLPVEKAVITHAHSDHARWGMGRNLCHPHTAAILRLRLGADISIQQLEYGEVVTVNGVRISLHPAGHIIGSAQVRLEYGGEVWVASGDYKLTSDGISVPFEPVCCHTFVTESTFALPIYRFPDPAVVLSDINHWWRRNATDGLPMHGRRNLLESLLSSNTASYPMLLLSESMSFNSWNEVAGFRERARGFRCEGVMLKRKDSPYGSGRRRGSWWKWKTDPLTADGVLIYAQSGHGRRANLYTDYTFAVWDEAGTWVPFAKAYSGLTDKEITELDNWIKRNTEERFGPVRSVTPHHVFEIAFEGIQQSSRHKSGVAPR